MQGGWIWTCYVAGNQIDCDDPPEFARVGMSGHLVVPRFAQVSMALGSDYFDLEDRVYRLNCSQRILVGWVEAASADDVMSPPRELWQIAL